MVARLSKQIQIVLLFSVFVLFSTRVYAESAFFPRYPALSPDGSTVAFSYAGDIWSVPVYGGQATRLTANPAYDRSPVYSPDGKWLAFASNRYGSFDIFVMPSSGGSPTRLTFALPTDLTVGWDADGKSILFSSREQFDYPMNPQIYRVPMTGGTPTRLVDCFATQAATSPDGKSYLLAIGDNFFGRKGYRGTHQSDIYLYRPGSDPVQLTTWRGYDTDPMWSSDQTAFFYRSDSTGTFNLWIKDINETITRQVTFFKNDGVRTASISKDGYNIVVEADSSLYELNASPVATIKRIEINVADDAIENPVSTQSVTSGASELAVSTDGSEYAMTIHGEIVLVNRELGGRAVVPVPSPARDNQPSFKPGCTDTLIFTTDRWGYQAVAMLVSNDTGKVSLRKAHHTKLLRLTNDSADCRQAKWSPKGDKIAYIHDKGQIRIMNTDGSNDHLLADNWSETEFNWSPDGRWIAYSTEDNDYNADIWIIPSDGSAKPVNISQHPDEDSNPVWSADGRMLAWTSMRHERHNDVYFVYLRKEDNDRSDEDWKEWEKTRDKEKKGEDKSKDSTKTSKGKGKKAEIDSVKIDFDDIYLRVRRVTNLSGEESVVAIHPKGDKFYFTADVKNKRDLYSVNRFGEELKAITEGGTNPSAITLDADGKTFYYLHNGSPASIGTDGGKGEGTSFHAMLKIDQPGERLEVLDEAWRKLGMSYYDPKMHGADWKALRSKYKPYAEHVRAEKDFEDVINLLLGEINSSHTGFYQDGDNNFRESAGELGLTFDTKAKSEGLKIVSVLRDGPCDKTGVNLQAGDELLAIDGVPVSLEHDVYEPLQGKTGLPVLLSIRRNGHYSEVTAIPGSWFAMRQLVYEEMERKNRDIVAKATDNRVAYVHIQGMDRHSLEVFQRDLFAAADGRDAMIIDVRNNGGGSTTDLLLTILTQPEHAYTQSRGSGYGYPQDRLALYKWTKPICVLCNEASFSNAEIFSHAIQTIHRGPVIGTETAGGVISTGGWGTLDGGYVRLPGRGWWIYGTKIEEEGHGCVPDYPVAMTPADFIHDRDPQLAKAIDVMKQTVEENDHKPGITGESKKH